MTVLVLLTLLSTAVAVCSSLVAWRLARDARRRSEARVAALATAIAADPGASAPVVSLALGRSTSTGPVPATARGGDADLPLAQPDGAPRDPAGTDELFASTQQGATGWRPRPALAIAAIAGITVLGTLLIASRSERPASPEKPAAPLELLALRHVQEGGTTTITGLVRNPSGGTAMERTTAVVFFFDASGTFLASARGPLDFTRLAAGEESPFHVSLATPQGAARYRVSFRYAEGGIVPHVDRRKN